MRNFVTTRPYRCPRSALVRSGYRVASSYVPLMLVICCLASLFGAVAASSADAYIYWANRDGGSGTTLGRANLDGTAIDESFIEGATGPVGLAVDATHIFWANTFGTHSTIGRAKLDGTEATQTFITGASSPCGVAVNSEYIYWGNNGTGTIGRAKLDGEEVNESFITGADHPCGVAVDASHVYWANQTSTTIGRANLNGTEADENFITSATEPVGVAVNSSHIYWGNNESGTLGRANLDGGEANNSFITGSGSCTDFPAVDATYVYWANDCASSIGRAKLDGTETEEDFISVLPNPGGVAVDLPQVVPISSPSQARPTVRLTAAEALRGKGVNVTLACSGSGGQSCQTTETLTSTEKLAGKKVTGIAARLAKHKARRRAVTVGSATMAIPAGQTAALLVSLNSTGRGLLKRFPKLPVTLTVALTTEGHTATVATQKLTIRGKHKGGRHKVRSR